MNTKKVLEGTVKEHLEVVEGLVAACGGEVEAIAEVMRVAIANGGKVLFCGNGGSAADSQHLAAELVVRFRRNRRALASLALTVDTSVLTACGNDFGYAEVFARQVEALGNPGDVLVGISTSGGSANVVRAMEAANERGLVTVAFCGGQRGQIAELAELVLAPPSEVTARVQECHLLCGHVMCDVLEAAFAEGG
ncbi:MAG: D-sedoheptulose 7-phosphate isomerase [Verrucomicrobiales bacterium]|nr:D-sedoheptulose 7-phosphate isomerase [Verrucomicrobiales bacterium]